MKNNFSEKVRQSAIKYAQLYKNKLLDYNYLICSTAFTQKDYYIINAQKNNYAHLLGIHTLLSPEEFFNKCYNGTLLTTDFDFIRKGQSEKEVKGYIRRKINSLQSGLEMFEQPIILAEENFSRNRIFCSFATSENSCTFGFINYNYSVPKTLLKGNELNASNTRYVDLVLRKHKKDKLYNEILLGDKNSVRKYFDKINKLLSKDIINNL